MARPGHRPGHGPDKPHGPSKALPPRVPPPPLEPCEILLVIRARCTSLTKRESPGHWSASFIVVYDDSIPPEHRMDVRTIPRVFQVDVENRALDQVFRPGQEYQVIMTPVPSDTT